MKQRQDASSESLRRGGIGQCVAWTRMLHGQSLLLSLGVLCEAGRDKESNTPTYLGPSSAKLCEVTLSRALIHRREAVVASVDLSAATHGPLSVPEPG